MSIVPVLQRPIDFLKGLGPRRVEALQKKLGIYTYKDLLQYYPFRYVDKTLFHKINTIATTEATMVQVIAKVRSYHLAGTGSSERIVATLFDETGEIEAVWFQGIKWLQEVLKKTNAFIFYGKINEFNGKYSIGHPEIEEYNKHKIHSPLEPVYPSTEYLKKIGLDNKAWMKAFENLFATIHEELAENLSPEVIQHFGLLSRIQALKNIHLPTNFILLEKAKQRLKVEELLLIQLRLVTQNIIRKEINQGFLLKETGAVFTDFIQNNLPFSLTNAQKRVVKEIWQDMKAGKQMNRLLQGDVGSGKTIVALLAMLLGIGNGYQACIIAPTEILAEQHFQSLQELLQGTGITVDILTGSTKKAYRKKLHEALQNGQIHLLVGTHAILEPTVVFQNLGVAVIDEQHRFGVAQRSKLWQKNTLPPHVLVMSATPIPRTLAMTLYGDLDLSILDELPPGRKPIKTSHLYENSRLKVFGFMREQIALGRQIYIVYPLIEESETMDYSNLMEGYDIVCNRFPMPEYQVSIVHGKMNSVQKEFEMQRFVKQETQIMVATTVIEVGINVPNASVMVIESSERFGLSQLHQLRGRVGRGADQSYCVLVTGNKLSADAKFRVETMTSTNDGFEIADADLKLRGMGDLQGTQQSGLIRLRIADLSRDADLVEKCRNLAITILQEDAHLLLPKNTLLKATLEDMLSETGEWGKIS